MSKSSLLLARFKKNNQPFNKETKTTMVVTILLSMVADHGKKLLQILVNIGLKKRTGALGTGANGTNTGLQHTIQKSSEYKTIPQKIRPTTQNRPIKSH